MEKKAVVFLADGFEEIEGLTVVDLLRRAGVLVTTVSVTGQSLVHGAHGIDVQADRLFEEVSCEEQDLLVLPGGMPGTLHLEQHEGLRKVLEKAWDSQQLLAAICAAPSVFGKLGFLKGKKATSYPGFEEALEGAEYLTEEVVQDGRIITSRGLGTAIPFALVLIQNLFDEKKAKEIQESIIYSN